MKIAVIGAGNGGQALAAFLSSKGYDVSLFNRSLRRIAHIIETKRIRLEGIINGVFKLSLVSTNIEEVIKGRKLIMVVVPAFAHKSIAERIYPFLEDGQIILLNPGRTFGALEFYRTLREKGVRKKVIVAEAQTFLFASRISNPGVVKIFRMKNAVPVSAIPAIENPQLKEILREVIPEFEIAPNTIYTSFNNIGAVFHPSVQLLNSGRIESTAGAFQFYLDGITPSVAKVLEKVDEERCNVMKLFGVEPLTAKEWLNYAYDVVGSNLYEAIHNNDGYQGIYAPPSLYNRYILEDVPMSLVPISSAGKQFGEYTPTIDSVIHIASIMVSRDFWKEGRTMKNLGLEDKGIKEILKILEVGEE